MANSALINQAIADLPADLGLGSADQGPLADPGDHPIGGLRRQPEEGDLVGILDHPELAGDR
jgi:hypothetical protein